MSEHTEPIIPRCEHGRIVLGCPHDDCVTQSIFLWETDFALDRYYEERNRQFREAFGLAHPSQVDDEHGADGA